MAVLRRVGLQALKAALRVVKHTGRFQKADVLIGNQSALIPGAVLPFRLPAVVRFRVAEAELGPIDVFLFHN